MNWEDVLSLLAVSGVVDQTYVLVHDCGRPLGSRSVSWALLTSVDSHLGARISLRFSLLASVQEDQLVTPPVLRLSVLEHRAYPIRR